MTEKIINSIQNDAEYKQFREQWRVCEIFERQNGADASLSAKSGNGWMNIEMLRVTAHDDEPDEEVRQEYIDFQLEQAGDRLRVMDKFRNSRHILPCDTAVHTLPAASGEQDFHYFTAVYAHVSGGELQPVGTSFSGSAKELRKLAVEICKALAEFHEEDELHQFIHPDNIFLTSEGNYCLGRAGLKQDAEKLRKSDLYPQESYDAQSDILMLGKCLAMLISSNEELQNGRDKEIRRLSVIIERACAWDKSARYQSAEAMLRDLEKNSLIGKKTLFFVIGGALLLILLGCLLAAFLGRSADAPAPDEESSVTETAAETTQKGEATPGDANGDGTLDALDAAKILEMSAGSAFEELSAEELAVYDLNDDGEVNAVDSALLLGYSAYTVMGGTDSLSQYMTDRTEG